MPKRKTAASKATTRKRAPKRELIDTGTDKRFVRRGLGARFQESDDVSRVWRPTGGKANTESKSAQGDRGPTVGEQDDRQD